MAHAQRLLPIEQLLSDVAAGPSGAVVKTMSAPAEVRRNESLPSARSNPVSPFAADSARKGGPKAETSGDTTTFADEGPFDSRSGQVRATRPSAGSTANVVIMGSAAPAVEELQMEPEAQPVARIETRPEANAESLRDAVLNSLGNQQMLVSILEIAEWSLNGSLLTAKVVASGTMIEMSFTAEARRIASAAASGRAGRPIRVQVEAGGVPQASSAPRRAPASNGSARSRAEQDPVVQQMQETFGAEIRTVIDYREKG
jgi:DNA polymerase-3 subunit gamma/tau